MTQEALTNVGRHAGATVVELDLGGRRAAWSCACATTARASTRRGHPRGRRTAPAGGLGLAGMAERARLVGGELDVRSAPGGGTTSAHDQGAGVIRVLIADDHGIVRSGLRMLIDRQPDMEVVAEADDGVAALERPRRSAPTWRCSTSRCRA